MRRRYCPACRGERYDFVDVSPQASSSYALGSAVFVPAMQSSVKTRFCLAIGLQYAMVCGANLKPNVRLDYPSDSGKWVDRDQMDSFMREYCSSSDKTGLLDEKRKQYQAINLV